MLLPVAQLFSTPPTINFPGPAVSQVPICSVFHFAPGTGEVTGLGHGTTPCGSYKKCRPPVGAAKLPSSPQSFSTPLRMYFPATLGPTQVALSFFQLLLQSQVQSPATADPALLVQTGMIGQRHRNRALGDRFVVGCRKIT